MEWVVWLGALVAALASRLKANQIIVGGVMLVGLFVGLFGDGVMHKITFDASGQVKSNEVFADSIGMFAESKLDPARVCKMIDNNWE